jgi:hypothetical protein
MLFEKEIEIQVVDVRKHQVVQNKRRIVKIRRVQVDFGVVALVHKIAVNALAEVAVIYFVADKISVAAVVELEKAVFAVLFEG